MSRLSNVQFVVGSILAPLSNLRSFLVFVDLGLPFLLKSMSHPGSLNRLLSRDITHRSVLHFQEATQWLDLLPLPLHNVYSYCLWQNNHNIAYFAKQHTNDSKPKINSTFLVITLFICLGTFFKRKRYVLVATSHVL